MKTFPTCTSRLDKIDFDEWDWVPGAKEAITPGPVDKKGRPLLAWEYCSCCQRKKLGRPGAFTMDALFTLERLLKETRKYKAVHIDGKIARHTKHDYPFLHGDLFLRYDYTVMEYPLQLWAMSQCKPRVLRGVSKVGDYLQQQGLITHATWQDDLGWVKDASGRVRLKGKWAITKTGIDFIRQRIEIPAAVIVSSNDANKTQGPEFRAESYVKASLHDYTMWWADGKAPSWSEDLAGQLLTYGLDDLAELTEGL